MGNVQSAMLAQRSSAPPRKVGAGKQREKMLKTQAGQQQVLPVAQEVRSKPPAKLKTIHQLKATDRPADVKARLQKRAQKMHCDLCTSKYLANHLRSAMPSQVTQLVTDIGHCQQAIYAWRRDVTATATEIVAKFNDLLQEDVTLRIR